MKTKEQLAEQYAEGKSSAEVFKNTHKTDFLAGYEAGQPKWISVDEQTPSDDREVIVYVRNHKTPWWSGNHFGAYINKKWYLKDGIKDEYEIIKWVEIPQEKELKTVEEWNKIFNKIIILDNDGFKDLTSEQKISERDFVSRLTRCTINL